MVCAGEEKSGAAGDGTEFADSQCIVVYRIMVKDISGFKFQGIMDEIIVDGIVSDKDVRPRNGRLQINGFPILAAGIDFSRIHSGLLSEASQTPPSSGAASQEGKRYSFLWSNRLFSTQVTVRAFLEYTKETRVAQSPS